MTTHPVAPKRKNIKIQPPHFKPRDLRSYPRQKVPILAFDPGGTTGWSLLVLPRKINGKDVFSFNLDTILHTLTWEHGELVTTGDEDGAAYQMAKMCNAWPNAAIVVEDFILRSERKEKSRDLLSPVRLTAKLETYLWKGNRKPLLQTPAQAKTTVTDERLALWGVKVDDGLPDHARDADRHAVLFLRRCIGPQGVAVKRAAWPHLYGSLEEEMENESA